MFLRLIFVSHLLPPPVRERDVVLPGRHLVLPVLLVAVVVAGVVVKDLEYTYISMTLEFCGFKLYFTFCDDFIC